MALDTIQVIFQLPLDTGMNPAEHETPEHARGRRHVWEGTLWLLSESAGQSHRTRACCLGSDVGNHLVQPLAGDEAAPCTRQQGSHQPEP